MAVAGRRRGGPAPLAGCTGGAGPPGAGTGTAGRPAAAGPAAPGGHRGLAAVRHVWVIELENQGYAQSFGTPSADPYLAKTLPRLGALLENYYAIGHASADNYIAQVSGQAPDLGTQAEDYARAVTLLEYSNPKEINRRVSLRMARQGILFRPGPTSLHVVVDEAALRRPIGGTAVMRAQLKHLIEISQRPSVTIQVLPFKMGGHSAVGGPFSET
jgi:hypothetical protein